MQKKNSYRSAKALGQIFDKVSRQPTEFSPEWEHDFDQRILTSCQVDDEMVAAAGRIKVQYDTSVRRILAQHGVSTEFELWTGFAMSRPAVGTEYKRQEQLGKEYDSLRGRFRDMCYEAAGGREPDVIDRFVVAMYKVTEQQVKDALAKLASDTADNDDDDDDNDGAEAASHPNDTTGMPLISFPWIFHSVMIRIAHSSED